MILINLLPHREERRKRRKTAFFIVTGAIAFVGFSLVLAWYLLMQQIIFGQQQRNVFLQTKISELDSQIQDVSALRSDIEKLKARQNAVEGLQSDRNLPVNIFSELVRQTPDGVYLSSVTQEGRSLTVSGLAQSNERVSEFLRNTTNSEWFSKPDLISIEASGKASGQNGAFRDSMRLLDFSMRIGIKQPVSAEPSKNPDAASPSSGSQPKV